MLEQLDIHRPKKVKLDLSLEPYTKKKKRKKINIKYQGFIVKWENTKALEKEFFQDLGLGNEFLGLTATAQFIKEKNGKLDFILLKTFVLRKALLRGLKWKLQSDRKY